MAIFVPNEKKIIMKGITEINTCTNYCGCGGCFEQIQDSSFNLDKLEKNQDFEYFIPVTEEHHIHFIFELVDNEVVLISSEYKGEPYELTEVSLNALIKKVELNSEFEFEDSNWVSDLEQFGMSGTL